MKFNKKSSLFTGTVNIGLRGFILGLKFLFTLILVKIISIEAYGEYSLFMASVSLGGFLFSWDFYMFTTREIASSFDDNKVEEIIINQFKFHFITFLIVAPFFLILFYIDTLNFQYLSLFYLVLFFDNIAQELFRLLIAVGKSIKANIVFALKSVPFVIIILVAWQFKMEWILNLKVIFFLTFLSTLIATLTGFIYLELNLTKLFTTNLNSEILIKGFTVAITFFIATISFKLIEFSGRYVLDFLYGRFETGIYSFFFALANIVFIITQAGVFHVYGPKLIRSYTLSLKNGDDEFKDLFKSFSILVIILTISLSFVIYFLSPIFLNYLDKPELIENLDVLTILLIGIVLFSLSFIPHYFMYVNQKDKLLLFSMVSALIVYIILIFPLTNNFGIIGSAITTSSAFAVVFLMKTFFSFYIYKQTFETNK